MSEKEKLPISPSLKVIDFRTVAKAPRWWAAVVLCEAYGRKNLNYYLWQRKKGAWKRKHKFTVQSKKKWQKLSGAVEELLPKLEG